MKFLRKLCALFRRQKIDTEMAEEMRAHLEMQLEKNIAAGANPDEARYLAQRQFGNVARIQEMCREQRGWVWLEQWGRDFRFSFRSLRRSAGFSVTVIVTLALCIGANTTIMSALYGLILKPMPFSNPGQLVEVYNSQPKNNEPKLRIGVTQYLDYKANADLFEGFAMWTRWTFNIGEDADVERGVGARVTPDYFALLGVQPLLGRFYTMEECTPGKDAVLVLTETFWERKFQADPTVIGRVIRLGGEPFTIIGVSPRCLEALNTDTTLLKPFDWVPRRATSQARWDEAAILYARMKPDVTSVAARAQLMALEKRAEEEAPPAERDFLERTGFEIGIGNVRAEQTASVRASLLLLQSGAMFVLLLGCLNVANLMLARANARQTELAIRQALGAGRGALARQMLVEGVLLALTGAAVGLTLSWSSLRVINDYTTAIVPEVQPITIDRMVLAVTLLTAATVALLIALLPMLRTWRRNLVVSLQGGSRGASAGGGTRAASSLLVVTQVALALVLLIGTGLLLRSFSLVLKVDPGFDATHVVQGRTEFIRPGMTREAIKNMQDLIIARMKEIPGVEQIGCTNVFPLSPAFNVSNFTIRGSNLGPGEVPPAAVGLMVSPGYIGAMGIRLIEGRDFNETDAANGRRAILVDENFAKKYFPGRSAVGEPVVFGGGPLPPLEQWSRIVGVVASAKLFGLENRGTPVAYAAMGAAHAFSMVLRTSRPAKEIVPLMRAKLRSVDPSAPLYHAGSLQDELDHMLANRRGVLLLLGVFSGIALLLSAVGIYGMLAYDVTQRTREIGIRGAIGASRGQIVGLIVRQGLWKSGTGLVIGLGGALYLSRYLVSLLFEVKPTDPVVFGGVTMALFLVALVASWFPARRAAKIDPVIALRAE